VKVVVEVIVAGRPRSRPSAEIPAGGVFGLAGIGAIAIFEGTVAERARAGAEPIDRGGI